MTARRPRSRSVITMTTLAAAFIVSVPAPRSRADEQKTIAAKPAEPKPAEADPALQAMLDRRLPEINFNGNSLSDVIDFLRDVTGANISVNWNILEAAGVKKDSPVSTRLKDVKFRTALKIILDELSSDKVRIGWTLTDNVLVISTVEEPKPQK